MFSFTTLTLFSSLFAAQTLAAPTTFLNKRQDTTSCYPTAGFTTTINGISTRDAWAVEEKNGFPIAVSLVCLSFLLLSMSSRTDHKFVSL